MSVRVSVSPQVIDARKYILDWSATPATFMTYLQNAVTAAAGSTLVFPEAVYKFRHDIGYRIDVSSDTTLKMLGGYFDVTGGDFGNTELAAAGESGSNYLGVGFRVRATSDGTAKSNIVFDGLDFRGDYTGIWKGGTFYQSTVIDGWFTTTALNRDIHVRNCKFKNLYGFPVHMQATNDVGSGLSSGYLFSFTNNTIDTCGNGVNWNLPNSLLAHNQFYNVEGFECAGANTTIVHNHFKDVYGAIALGGDTTANRELPGGIVAFNQIDTDFTDQSIVLQDGAVGSIVAFNVVRKARRIGIYVGLASTGVVPRDVQVIGNQLISCGQIINAWASTTAYVVGDWVHKTVGTSGDAFVCTVAGTSGGSEPTWPTVDGDTVVSGTATFMLKGNFNSSSRYAMYVPSDNVQVANNRIYVESDDTATWQPTEGILVQGDNCTVVNNSSNGASLYDIDVDGTFTTTKGQNTKLAGNRTTIAIKVQRGATATGAQGSTTKNWASIADGDNATQTVTVDGAALGMDATAWMNIDLQGLQLTAYVSAANTVTCVLSNTTGGAVDLGSGTLYAKTRTD